MEWTLGPLFGVWRERPIFGYVYEYATAVIYTKNGFTPCRSDKVYQKLALTAFATRERLFNNAVFSI